MNALLLIVGLLIAWSIWGALSSRVEQTVYTVVKKTRGYEIREYPAHLVAQTTVQGDYREAVGTGFRIIAGYIFGGNTKKEKIAMTAPVVARQEGGAYTITFGMPRNYTLETLPVPNDARVHLVEVPPRRYAVIRFSGWRTDAREKDTVERLIKLLAHDGIPARGTHSYAGYNAPWTPPWLQRHEVLIELR